MNQARPWGGASDPRLRPPYPPDLLADLDAGALDSALAAELWPRARAEPDAARVLAALASTRGELAEHGRAPTTVTVPDEVRARIDAALAGLAPPGPTPRSAEPAGPVRTAPVGDLAVARARRRRPRGILVAAAAAAVGIVAVGVLGGVVPGGSTTVGTALPADSVGHLADPADGGVPELSAADLGSALSLVGTRDLGPLTTDAALAACLSANGVAPDTELLGSSPVRLDGVEGLLLLLPTGTVGRLTALVVGPGCSADDPAELVRRDIGAR